jgi:hypothetical protein
VEVASQPLNVLNVNYGDIKLMSKSNYDAIEYSLEYHLARVKSSKSNYAITTDPSVQTVFGPIEDEQNKYFYPMKAGVITEIKDGTIIRSYFGVQVQDHYCCLEGGFETLQEAIDWIKNDETWCRS